MAGQMARMPSCSYMYRRADATAIGVHSIVTGGAAASSLAVQQLRHDLVVWPRALASPPGPLVMRRERGLHGGLLQPLALSEPLHRTQPAQIRDGDDSSRFA